MTLKRIRISIAVEVDVASDEEKATVVHKFADTVMPALARKFRRTDTPTLEVNDLPDPV